MTIEFKVYKLEDVIQFFVQGMQAPPGQIIVSEEHWVDPVRGEVLFKIFIEQGGNDAHPVHPIPAARRKTPAN